MISFVFEFPILIILSILPVFLIGWYIYSKDRKKEPFKIIVINFLTGILSCFITLVVTIILSLFFPIMLEETTNMNYIELAFYIFVGIALIEETSKWLMVYLFAYNSKYLDESYDLILYSVFVALGFAMFENILYVFQGGVSIALLRCFTAIPGHTCYGVIMGYFLLKNKSNSVSNEEKKKNTLVSIFLPTVIHFVYDYCLLSEKSFMVLIFIAILVCMYIFTIKIIRKVSKNNYMFYKNNYCINCGSCVKGCKYCIVCGNKVN